MELIIATRAQVDVTQASDKHGQRYALIIAKATYDFPSQNDRRPLLARKPMPLLAADTFEGEPGLSAPCFESDYVLRKAKCDVVLKATAHAPEGKPVERLRVGFRLAGCAKEADIVGERRWQRGLLGLGISAITPFSKMPISYGRAYGGSWGGETDKDKPECYLANPVGCGFGGKKHQHKLVGTALPNVEQPGKPVKDSNGSYRPWSFGPLARSWPPRLALAGTYDAAWQAEVFPQLPADFDEGYFQCAPADQQIAYPQGGELLELFHLHPQRAHIRFPLPTQALGMRVLTRERRTVVLKPVIDTILIDADAEQFALVWRAQLPIQRSLREIEAVAVGMVPEARWAGIAGGAGDCGCGGKAEQSTDQTEQAAV